MVLIREENLASNLDDMRILAVDHFNEVSMHKGAFELAMDWDIRSKMQEKGMYLFVTVKEGAELIGYYMGFLINLIHSKNTTSCQTESFYIKPSKRTSILGVKLFREVERILKAKKVQSWSMGCSGNKNTSAIFRRVGAKFHEVIYSKVLGDKHV